MAAIAIAAWAISDAAVADSPTGLGARPVAPEVSLFAGADAAGASQVGVQFHWYPPMDTLAELRAPWRGATATAGTTLRGTGGWSAKLFVSYLGPRQASDDEQVRMRSSTVVNAQVLHRLSRKTRVTFDVFNVFDHRMDAVDAFASSRIGPLPGSMESYLFHPAERRGFRLALRTTF